MSGPRPDGGRLAPLLPALPGAACRDRDPALFFGDDGEKYRARLAREARARAVCLGCPVRLPCLAFAAGHGITEGIWGGLTEAERRAGPRLCRNGLHPMDAANARAGGDGHEACRACKAAAQRRYEAARSAA